MEIGCGQQTIKQTPHSRPSLPACNLTLRRLRGGVKIRASEFLGGGGMPPIIETSPPPATASRSHPPPQAAGGKNSFIPLIFPFPLPYSIPAKAGISSRECGKFREAEVQCRLRRCVADDAAPRDSRFRGNGSFLISRLCLFYSRFPFPPSSIPAPPFHSRPLPFPRKRESLPANAGNSAKRKCNVAYGDAWRTMPPREIPAFAGMECFFFAK